MNLMLDLRRTFILLVLAVSSSAIANESVHLGDPTLTAGIPGEGPLTLDAIEAWLANPANHRPLRPILPLGMNAGQNQIQGLRDNPLTRAKIELGRQLYFDPRLSGDSSVSCASCHAPEHGYAFDSQFGIGIEGQEGGRNSPTAMNRILSTKQFWDGRAESLEEQAVGPIENPIEMGNTHSACTECLAGIAGYGRQFRAIFDDGVTIENVGKAIASFERAIVSGPSAWDYHEQLARFEKVYAEDLADPKYLEEEEPELLAEHERLKQAAAASPLSQSAERGAELFFSAATNCTHCHAGPNFTDEQYHNLGVGLEAYDEAYKPDEGPNSLLDWGRSTITTDDDDKNDEDRGAFKTPSLRNVAQTGPYMHDGSLKTLRDVVDWYDQGGQENPWLSEQIFELGLTEQEKDDLVAFLEALTGELPEVEQERLPQ